MANEMRSVFTCRDIPKRSFHFFEEMKKKGELCDITFQVGNEVISAHRIIITAVIPSFRDILSSKDGCKGEQGISLPGIEPSALKCLIEFAYSCQVEIHAENVRSLLAAACSLGVRDVREACCDFLINCLEPDNVMNIREFAHHLNCLELLESIDCYVKENFEEMSQSSDFLNSSSTYLKELIGKEDLRVDNEEKVFEAVLKWANESREERKDELPELMSKIRMPLLDPLYLAKIVQREELIRSSLLCRDLIEEARNYNLHPEIRNTVSSFPTEHRQSIKITHAAEKNDNPCIYSLSIGVTFTAQYFNLMEGKWQPKKSTEIDIRKRGSTSELRNKIYFFAWGYSMRYDPAMDSYQILSAIPTLRYSTGSTCLKNKIYVCGGEIGCAASNAVECLDPEKNEWSSSSSMPTARWAASVVALGECIFVLGGQDDDSVFDSVERFDPVMDKWRRMSPMLTKRSYAGAATLNGKIYICGGSTTPSGTAGFLATAEVYDPIKNKWKFISPMETVRHGLTLLPCLGKLYALGGYNNSVEWANNREWAKNFAIYDPESDEWASGPATDAKHFPVYAVVMSAANI